MPSPGHTSAGTNVTFQFHRLSPRGVLPHAGDYPTLTGDPNHTPISRDWSFGFKSRFPLENAGLGLGLDSLVHFSSHALPFFSPISSFHTLSFSPRSLVHGGQTQASARRISYLLPPQLYIRYCSNKQQQQEEPGKTGAPWACLKVPGSSRVPRVFASSFSTGAPRRTSLLLQCHRKTTPRTRSVSSAPWRHSISH